MLRGVGHVTIARQSKWHHEVEEVQVEPLRAFA
jgi:hypothetical protein